MPDVDFFSPQDAPRDGRWVIFYFADPPHADSKQLVIATFKPDRSVWLDRFGGVVDVSQAKAASVL